MVRINITLPNDVQKELSRIKNKSHYIAQALREKFLEERKKEADQMLHKAYQQASKEDKQLSKEWDATINDGELE